ncbi:hypothetical protein SAMN05518672_1011356 [Chitinophaga sp. CF118]|uniref:hypothetical protein n=1 Tax=Chitinophaga sp. CF118 TaxID=1884367 RepID=UPI0008DEAC45|nr:hypothetical protein [Chitinophaga sp. CF118]SFD26639.1 hypothetical protein SAMN05518672_1011356 [Chitinophaga sp. CF118]
MLTFRSFTSLYTGEIVPAITFLPIIAAIWQYRVITRSLKAILFYLCVAVVFNYTATILSHSNNLPLLHIYTVVEFLLLIRFYFYMLPGERMKRSMILMSILFPLWAVINSLVVQSIYGFNSYSRGVEAVIMIIFGVIFIRRSANDDNNEEWNRIPENWVNAGILLYFSGALSQFAFSNIVSANAPNVFKMVIWDIHATFVLIMYLLFTVAFLKCRR